MNHGAVSAATAERGNRALRCWLLPRACLLLVAALSSAAPAAPIHNPDYGHDYEAVAHSSGINWHDANAAANARTFKGMHGHLATITSPGENDFIVQNLPGAVDGGFWLGGFQSHGLLDPAAGWQWVTGEPWSYTNWNVITGAEPNDYEGPGTSDQDENRLHFWYQSGGVWNDLRPFDSPPGYVVEYEPDPSPDIPVITGYAVDQPGIASPSNAPPGTLLRVIGTHLGSEGTVLFDGLLLPAAVAGWSPVEIRLWVPSAPSYPFQTHVTVVADRKRADGASYTIAAPTPGQDNLLANGSFEFPSSAGSSVDWGYTYGQPLEPDYPGYNGFSIPGWRIPIGTIDVYRTGWQEAPGQGRQSIDLVGSPFAGIITQTFLTEPGREYDFSGWMAHNPGLLEARADVFLNDQFFVQLFHKGYNSAADMLWTPFVFRFRAKDIQTTLAIEDVTGRTHFHGAALDGLSVTLAPN
jgi:hypothetical protein